MPGGGELRRRARIDFAEQVLDPCDCDVCGEDFTQWTWQPQVLLQARRNLGETIQALTQLVSENEMASAADARRNAVLQRQRAMLKARSEAAGR